MRLSTWLRHFRLPSLLLRGDRPFGFLIRAAMEAASSRGQVRGFLAEVPQGGGPDAVKPAAEVHAVDVKLQHLFLAVPFRDAPRQGYFHKLAAKASFVPRLGPVFQVVGVSGKLLGDGGGSLVGLPAVAGVFLGRSQNPQEIVARMFPEARVLLGDQGVDHGGGNFIQRHITAVFHVNAAYFLPVPVKNDARLLHVVDAFQVKLRGPVVVALPGGHEAEVPHGAADQGQNEAPGDEFLTKPGNGSGAWPWDAAFCLPGRVCAEPVNLIQP